MSEAPSYTGLDDEWVLHPGTIPHALFRGALFGNEFTVLDKNAPVVLRTAPSLSEYVPDGIEWFQSGKSGVLWAFGLGELIGLV